MKKRFLCLVLSVLVSTVGLAAAINSSSQAPQTAEDRLNQVLKEDGFIYGVLVPWNGDMGLGTDIGGTYRDGYKSNFSETKWLEKLTNCKAIGFNMVKLWLSERMEGIKFDETGRVIGIEENYKKNLITILDMAKSLDINIGLTFISHLSMSANNKADYDFSTRFIFNADYTKGYIENFVNPMMELVSQYDNILMIDLYAEPEGDTYGKQGNYGLDRGTSWENMSRFIRELGAAVKKCDPHMPITANTGWRSYDPLINGRYNDLGLDYIGIDIYNDYGEVTPVKQLKVTAPVMIGEFGVATNSNWSDDFQTQTTEKFYENARNGGYKGAFYWMYGWAQPTGGESVTIVGRNGELRPVATSLRFASLDREYQKTGYSGIDKPAFIYSSSALNIKWFGSRGAVAYTLERSSDKKSWSKLADITSPETIEYGPYMFRYEDKTAQQGNTYYYRIAAIDDEGKKVYSDASMPYKMKVITCPDEDNLVKNHDFEDGDDGSWDWERNGDVAGKSDMEVITGTPGDTVYSGTKGVHIVSSVPWNTNLKQWIDVKPNTDYTYTVYYKLIRGYTVLKILNEDYTTHDGDKHPVQSEDWNYYTFDFNSGNNNKMLVVWADGDSEAYVDGFYVFEKK